MDNETKHNRNRESHVAVFNGTAALKWVSEPTTTTSQVKVKKYADVISIFRKLSPPAKSDYWNDYDMELSVNFPDYLLG